MLVPVRCFTCNAGVGHHWPAYEAEVACGDEDFNAWCSRRGIARYCCRRMLLGHVDVGRAVAEFRFENTRRGTAHFRCTATRARTVSCD